MQTIKSDPLSFQPIFVCGAPRSGTTLMSALLSTSLQVNPFAAECEYLTSFIHSYVVGRDRYDIHTNCFFAGYDDFLRFQGNMLKKVLTHYWQSLDEPQSLVLKDPGMTRYANLFLNFIETSKVVMMIRDPRDVVASRIQIELRRIGSEDVEQVADYVIDAVCEQYNYCYEFVLRHATEMQQRTLFVEYETLSAGEGLDRLRAFTGLQDIELERLWQRRVSGWQRKTYEEWSSSLNGTPLSQASVASYQNWLSDRHEKKVREQSWTTYQGLLELVL